MAKSLETLSGTSPYRVRSRILGRVLSVGIVVYSWFLKWRLVDHLGRDQENFQAPVIWTVWHNRILMVPVVYRKYLRERQGAVLTSASKDGEIIAALMRCFGVSAVRGSSSRRGASALLGLVDWMKSGYDVCVIPDGPRGPRYRLAPGVVKLSQLTGGGVLPIRVDYSSYWSFRSWDRFRVPKPFSTVTVTLEPLWRAPENLTETEFENLRQGLEGVMNPGHETD